MLSSLGGDSKLPAQRARRARPASVSPGATATMATGGCKTPFKNAKSLEGLCKPGGEEKARI